MIKSKIALIFGITGQDGSYLAKYLLNKNTMRISQQTNNKRVKSSLSANKFFRKFYKI